jgi:hypothetical protein
MNFASFLAFFSFYDSLNSGIFSESYRKGAKEFEWIVRKKSEKVKKEGKLEIGRINNSDLLNEF